MSQKKPWAVLLCKFSDDRRGFVAVNRPNVDTMFTANDVENVPTFWQDVSYGELDLRGSQTFGWLTLSQKQTDYLGSGTVSEGRRALVDWAKAAAGAAGVDLSPFFGVAVFMSTRTDLWGSDNTVVCDVDSSLAQILQEYGHGYGLRHSRAVANPIDYANPFCIMSGMTFGDTDPTFTDRFGASGPLLCAPYVDAAGWLAPWRIARLEANGTRPALATLRLSPLGGLAPPNRQVAIFDLNTPFETTYYIEFRAGGWDRGMAQNQVVIHQRRPDGFAYFAGNIPTSIGSLGGVTLLPGRSWTDPQFDLSVRLSAVLDQGSTVEITVGAAAAVQALSLRGIARTNLNLTGGLAVRTQVLQPTTAGSLRTSLLNLVHR